MTNLSAINFHDKPEWPNTTDGTKLGKEQLETVRETVAALVACITPDDNDCLPHGPKILIGDCCVPALALPRVLDSKQPQARKLIHACGNRSCLNVDHMREFADRDACVWEGCAKGIYARGVCIGHYTGLKFLENTFATGGFAEDGSGTLAWNTFRDCRNKPINDAWQWVDYETHGGH